MRFFYLILLLLPFPLFSQIIGIVPNEVFVIVGIGNPVEILLKDFDPTNQKITIEDGTIKKEGEQYYITCHKPGRKNLILWQRDSIIDTRVVNAFLLPDPIIGLAGYNQIILKDELNLISKIDMDPYNPFVQQGYKIISAELLIQKDLKFHEFRFPNDVLPDSAKSLIRSLKTGDKIWLDNVKVHLPDNTTRTFSEKFQIWDVPMAEISYRIPRDWRENYFDDYNMIRIDTIFDDRFYKFSKGELSSVEKLQSENQNSQTREYYGNGNIKSEYNYTNGRLNGSFKTYYPNGRIEKSGNYKLDTIKIDTVLTPDDLHSSMIIISDIRENKHGEWLYYNQKGKLVLKEFYESGILRKRKRTD